jgi:AcrR family transcriptional regulator
MEISPKVPLPLSRQVIEVAALYLIEDAGLDAFSTRKLADKLGCKAMSIYHYFPSKGHLMDALLDRVIAELTPLPGNGLRWAERLRAIAVDYRQLALRRPKIFGFIATHRMNTPFALAHIEGMLGVAAESGLGAEETARMFRSFGYYIMGCGLDEAAGYSRGPSTVEPVTDAVLARDYPRVVAAAPYFAPPQRAKTFHDGLDMLIEGWKRRAEAGSGVLP